MFRVGETIVARALDWLGRPLIVIPATMLEDRPDLIVAHLPPGVRMQGYAGAECGPRRRVIVHWSGGYEGRSWQGSEQLI